MKQNKLTYGGIFFLFVLATSFSAPKSATYKIDEKKSKVTWIGKKVTASHTGAIAIEMGNFLVEDNKLKGGTFVMDMNSITCTDITNAADNQSLLDHFRRDDFFASYKFSNSTFVITSVEEKGKNLYAVTGDLTIKEITHEEKFAATVKINSSGVLNAKAKLVIDRTRYDIKYGSTTFFDKLGDMALNNEFEINLNLFAKVN